MTKYEVSYINKPEFKDMTLTLNRIDSALKAVNFKASTLGKVVHIAGTNGKGTTTYFLAQMLRANNISVCTFTSPHILKVNERLTSNHENITDSKLNELFTRYEDVIDEHRLSYFEGLLFLALIWFSEQAPLVTILETGLGGTFDATNTNAITNKLCVVTKLAHDHANILGKNIYDIINEKLGILRPTSTLILAENKDFIKSYISSTVSNNIIQVKLLDFAKDNYPHPYAENYCTAKKILETLLHKPTPDFHNLKLLPCRQEKLNDRVMLDGSHNASGIMSLFNSNAVGKNPAILASFTVDRDIQSLVKILENYSDDIIITTIPNNERSISAEHINRFSDRFIECPLEAMNHLLSKEKEVLVLGSFYLCAYVKQHCKAL